VSTETTGSTESPAAPTARPDLAVHLDGAVAVLEIRRPPANYFDEELVGAIVDTARGLDEDPACRALVLCSQGKHFCAGADFGDDIGFGDERVTVSDGLYRRAVQLFRTRKPIIAAVHGAAVGGGLGLACAADFRVADPSARFAANFARLGFHQGFGLSVTLPRIVGAQHAADMLYTGRRIDGSHAARIGLVDRLADPGTSRATALAWAHEIAAAAPLAVTSIRATLRAGLADQVEQALAHELTEQARLWATEDCAEGIGADLQRRRPTFHGR
jgi:enoyl-CoA hydratase/carnithine racemase